MFRLPIHCIALLALICMITPVSGADESPVGKQITNFSLDDFRGKVHQLSDYDSKAS